MTPRMVPGGGGELADVDEVRVEFDGAPTAAGVGERGVRPSDVNHDRKIRARRAGHRQRIPSPGMDLGSPFLVTLMLLGYVLTVASITRLINYDQVLDPVRLFIARRMSAAHEQAAQAELEGHPTVQEYAIRRRDRWALASDFMSCPWCVSPYIAAACAPAPAAARGARAAAGCAGPARPAPAGRRP